MLEGPIWHLEGDILNPGDFIKVQGTYRWSAVPEGCVWGATLPIFAPTQTQSIAKSSNVGSRIWETWLWPFQLPTDQPGHRGTEAGAATRICSSLFWIQQVTIALPAIEAAIPQFLLPFATCSCRSLAAWREGPALRWTKGRQRKLVASSRVSHTDLSA